MNERGSMIGSGALLVLLMLIFAVFGVDGSRYFLYNVRIQESADAAALAGGIALQQYTDDPNEILAIDAVLRHAAQNPGVILDPDEQITVARLKDNGDTPYYRVGVVLYGGFDPYFLPKQIFGDELHPIIKLAVAEIRSDRGGRLGKVSIECAIYVDAEAHFLGNNTEGDNVNVCSNNNVTIESPSTNFQLQDIYVYHSDSEEPAYSCTGPQCPDAVRSVRELSDPNPMPTFPHTDPADYDAVMNPDHWNDASLDNTLVNAACGSGHALPDAVWGGTLSPVCVSKDASGDTYVISAPSNSAGMIHYQDPSTLDLSPYTIYSEKNVVFDGGGSSTNHVGLSGGVYATGNIDIRDNNWDFVGDPDVLDGLSVWSAKQTDGGPYPDAATGTLRTRKNNVRLQGIIGAEEDIIIATEGGGGEPELIGVVVAHDEFTFDSNSQNALLQYDETVFNPDGLENSPWQTNGYVIQDEPLFASVQATLIL